MNETIVTLRELKNMISPTPGTDKQSKPDKPPEQIKLTKPTWREVEKKENPLVTYDDGCLRMAVFPSGFITAHSGRNHTIFRIEDCGAYAYRFCKRIPGDSSSHHLNAEYFQDQRWEIRVLMEAEDRLERNNNLYENRHAARF